MKTRIGQGFDVHAFGEGDHVMLGGVRIPFEKGLSAHSDGDVALHALCDALLGAAGLGDIGQHFPDSDKQYSNMDSRVFLQQVNQLIENQGFGLVNADMTIIAQAPKMAPHLHDMKLNLCDELNCELSCINIKATTTEGLGAIGQGDGIAATVTGWSG